MQKVFLSFHFDDAGKALADTASELVKSHNLQVVTGVRAGGEELSDRIKAEIERCDALICLMTDRNSDWIRDERAHAAANSKRTIAVVQEGIDDSGLFKGRERIGYDPNDPVPALLGLSATLGLWCQEAGRTIVAQIEPEEAVLFLAANRPYVKIGNRMPAFGLIALCGRGTQISPAFVRMA